MSPLTDPTRLSAYKDAISNWNVRLYITFELEERSHKWIREKLDGVTLKDIKRRMHEYVNNGGTIDEVRERRERWSGEHEFHYDLRFPIQGVSVYIETRLFLKNHFSQVNHLLR